MEENQERCLKCGKTSEEIPLIRLHHKQQDYWICPQDLPVLIHRPQQLAVFAEAYAASDAAMGRAED